MIASHIFASRHLFPDRPAHRRLAVAGSSVALVGGLSLALVVAGGPAQAAGPPDVGLGTAAQFAVLAGDGVTNTGPTNVTGDVGSFATTTVTDNGAIVPPGNVRRGPDLVVAGAKGDLLSAYNRAAGAQTSTTSLSAPDIGGLTLVGGTYNRAGSLGFTGTLTLDAQNDPDSVFIIQVGQDFTTATSAQVLLTRGAQACRVYWQIGNDAVVEVDTAFKGNILAGNDISAKTRARFEGRLLSKDGAVTLDTNTITLPACAPVVTTPAPSTATPVPTTSAPAAPGGVKPTKKPTAKPTGTPGSGADRGVDDEADGGGSGGSSDSSDSDGGASGGSATGTTGTSTGIPNTGGPPSFLAPAGVVAVLAGATLVAASRRSRDTHRA